MKQLFKLKVSCHGLFDKSTTQGSITVKSTLNYRIQTMEAWKVDLQDKRCIVGSMENYIEPIKEKT